VDEFADRLAEIRTRVGAALRRVGEPERPVTLVAVTKSVGAETVERLASLGVVEIGENRVQDALAKAGQVRAAVRWHMVGHLQRNKARRAAALFSVVHSVDSERLVDALAACERVPEIFLQVNVSGEPSKSGTTPEGVRGLRRAALARGLRVLGLMTMAPYAEDPEAARPVFRGLRELRETLDATGDGPPLEGLSMGMSDDFEVAVEEGATHVRIGTSLVGGIAARDR